MAVMITNLCINCHACVDECPATAILSVEQSDKEFTYVKPESCIECIDATSPKCADICPSDGAIVWDMPYTPEYNTYYQTHHENGIYTIRTHKIKGLLLPIVYEKPYRHTVPLTYRLSHQKVNIHEMNQWLLQAIHESSSSS